MPFTSRFGDLFMVPWDEVPSDKSQVIAVPGPTSLTTVTMLTVPANTLAVLRNVSFQLPQSSAANQLFAQVQVNRGGVTSAVGYLYSTNTTGVTSLFLFGLEIVLQPTDLLQLAYSSTDSVSRTIQIYCIVDTYNL